MAASNFHEVSATELELKRRGRRRLIGAITIGLLAIVFLPMIFDREPKRSGQPMKTQDISVLIPAKEGQPPLPAPSVAPLVVPAAPPTATAPLGAASIEPPRVADAKPGKVAPSVPVSTAMETAKTAKKADKPARPDVAATEKSAFVVQLGVFADADNAKLAVTKMKDAKLAVYTESIPIKTGNATRVRVGPFATRDKADAALAQVKLAGADGKIVALK